MERFAYTSIDRLGFICCKADSMTSTADKFKINCIYRCIGSIVLGKEQL